MAKRAGHPIWLLALVFFAFPCVGAFAGEGSALETAVQRFLATGDAAERVKAAEAVTDLDPRPQVLEALLKKGRKYKAGISRSDHDN